MARISRYVELSRWNALSAEERSKFPPLAPDSIVELRSRPDRLSDLQAKMVEYRDNGVRLGLLINPEDRQVEIYRCDAAVEVINFPESIDCDDVLPGFTLDLTKIW
jgi:Uma2 family endonuclease